MAKIHNLILHHLDRLLKFMNCIKTGHSKLHSYLTFTTCHILVCYIVPSDLKFRSLMMVTYVTKTCRSAKPKPCAVVGNETSVLKFRSSQIHDAMHVCTRVRAHTRTDTHACTHTHTHSFIMIRMCEHRDFQASQ
jgi:hypothetical protein